MKEWLSGSPFLLTNSARQSIGLSLMTGFPGVISANWKFETKIAEGVVAGSPSSIRTERVNVAQAIGAGAYVRKPYILERPLGKNWTDPLDAERIKFIFATGNIQCFFLISWKRA